METYVPTRSGPTDKELLLAARLQVPVERLPARLRELKGDQGYRPLARLLAEYYAVNVDQSWLSRFLRQHEQV